MQCQNKNAMLIQQKKTPKQNAEHTKNSIITGKNDVH